MRRSDVEPVGVLDGRTLTDALTAALLPMTRMAERLAPFSDPQDVVQDAIERAWRHRSRYDASRGSPTAWLLTITAAVAADAHRRSARRLRLWRSVPRQREGGADTTVDVDVDLAVRALPHRQRLAVTCFYFLDLSVADTAKVMNCSEGTVKSTLSDARRALRNVLGEPE